MELQHIQWNRIERLVDLTAAGIDEQPDRRNKRRQGCDDLARPLQADRPGTLGIKDQADGISARRRSGQGVLDTGDATYLAANDRQRNSTCHGKTGW